MFGTSSAHCRALALLASVLLVSSLGLGQNTDDETEFADLLERAVKLCQGRAEFMLVSWPIDPALGPEFYPTKGLDRKDAVPFLVDVLLGDPKWARDPLFQDTQGLYFHLARCYAALCLGAIGDNQAFGPLIRVLERPEIPEGYAEVVTKDNLDSVPSDGRYPPNYGGTASQYDERQKYPLVDYVMLGLGYLGDKRAVEPIILALPRLGQKYQFAAHALALLDDPRAVMPLIEHASRTGFLDLRVHCCLDHLTKAHFVILDGSERGTCKFLDFPELGEIPWDLAYLRLWEHWAKEGTSWAIRHAAWRYAKHKSLSQGSVEYPIRQAIFDDMARGGRAALVFIMEQIEKGDESLVPFIPEWLKPVRKNPFRAARSPLPANATRQQCLNWWKANKEHWLIGFRSGEKPTAQSQGDNTAGKDR